VLAHFASAEAGEFTTTIPRTSGKEVTRTKAYGVRDRVAG
jgi:hypothetical protein